MVAVATLVGVEVATARASKTPAAAEIDRDADAAYLDRSDGWEVGVGPSVVVVDAGMAKALTTTTLKGDAYAFFFDQSGLMAGLGLQGTKITKVNP